MNSQASLPLPLPLPLPLVVLLCGALLAADAAVQRRCTEVSEGRLQGAPLALAPILVPPAQRRYTLDIPYTETCGGGGAAGVVVTACDVVPPQVEVRATPAAEWGEARVLRLGPTWLPLLLELTLFCENHNPDTTVASISPDPRSKHLFHNATLRNIPYIHTISRPRRSG